MSMKMVAQVRDKSKSTGDAKFLLLTIASYIHPQSDEAFPSLITLAHAITKSKPYVLKLIGHLEALGELDVERGHGRGHSNRYRIPTAKPAADQAFSDLLASTTDEEVKALAALPYADFLGTPYWLTIRRYLLWKYEACQLCLSEDGLQVHHRSYRFRGAEVFHLEDLIVLCNDCHGRFHDQLAPEPL